MIAKVCATANVDPAGVFSGIEEPAIKAKLRENTEDLIARGGFGSPTLFVDTHDMYFGNDRVELAVRSLH